MRPAAVLAALVLLAPGAATAQGAMAEHATPLPPHPPGVTVVGPTGQTVELTPAQLGDMPRAEAPLHEGAKATLYQGPLLTAVVREAGTPTGPRSHGAPMRDYVKVTGQDGYSVTLSLAEIDADMQPGKVVLADQAASQPLVAREGPYRLVIGDDQKSWRAVRDVVRIEVKAAP